MVEDDPSAYDRMTEAQRRTAVWVEGYFGNTDFGRQNRESLLNMNVTGGAQGFYAQNIMSAVTKQMNHYRNTTDMSEVAIFNLMMGTLDRRAPTPPDTRVATPDPRTPITADTYEEIEEDATDGIVRMPDTSGIEYGRDLTPEERERAFVDKAAWQQRQLEKAMGPKELMMRSEPEVWGGHQGQQYGPDWVDQQNRAIGSFTAAVNNRNILEQQRQASRDAAYAQAMANPYPVGLNVPAGVPQNQFLGFGTTGDVPGFEDRGTGYIDPAEFYHQITNTPPVVEWR